MLYHRKVAERSTVSIAKRLVSSTVTNNSHTFCYKSYDEFYKIILSLKLPNGWTISKKSAENIRIYYSDDIHLIPQYEIYANISLSLQIRVCWLLPTDHIVYSDSGASMKNITLTNLIAAISSNLFCKGVSYTAESLVTHCIPKFLTQPSEKPLQQTECHRPEKCLVLCDAVKCKVCVNSEQQHERFKKRKSDMLLLPAQPNAPISITSPERIKLTIQSFRQENKDLKSRIEALQAEIQNSSISVSQNLNDDLVTIMSNIDPSKVSPFMQFFWKQQQKYLQSSSTGVRYHPMVIWYCLSIAAKSPSAYDDLRYDEKAGTGFLVLPSRRRLRDYKNYIRPESGFNSHIIDELKSKIEHFTDVEKFVVLLFDEMKIQENLVWNKHTGELIGYVDLGDPHLNFATLEKVDNNATHILVFMLRSIINPFKFSLANFATTSSQLFPLF